MSVYEFYPTLESGIAPTVDMLEFEDDAAARAYARQLIVDHPRAVKVVVVRDGTVVAEIYR